VEVGPETGRSVVEGDDVVGEGVTAAVGDIDAATETVAAGSGLDRNWFLDCFRNRFAPNRRTFGAANSAKGPLISQFMSGSSESVIMAIHV
jgi:hypothetical protein